jgi:hypothetical protein
VAAAAKPQAPEKVSLAAKVAKGRKRTLSGALTLPAGVTCPPGGTVSLSFSLGTKVVKRASAKLDGDCAYKVTATLPRSTAGRKITVRARFQTVGTLLARSAPERKVIVKR